MLTLLWTDRYTVGNVNAVVGGHTDTQWGMLTLLWTDTQWGMLTLLWTDTQWVMLTLLWTDRYTVGNVNTVVGGQTDTRWGMLTLLWVDRQIHGGEC